MQCEVRAMSDLREEGRGSRISDTLPKRGRVNEVCKEWLVHEDGALAYQLQQKEVAALWIVKRLENTLCQELYKLRMASEHLLAFMQEYYTGNKSRNAIVREDFPRARDEQIKEDCEALAKYQQMVHNQAEQDARLAKALAQRIQKQDEDQRKFVETQDQNIASHIQQKELKRVREAKVCQLSPLLGAVPVGDINSVGLPLPSDLENVSTKLRDLSLIKEEPVFYDLEQEEERQRILQEQKDEELARRLQEEEEELDSYEMLDKDRQLAIEAQDEELAKRLQDRERAKAKRARERARQRALLKKQQEEICTDIPECYESTRDHRISRPITDMSSPHKPRLPDPEEIEVISPVSTLPNIAMAIDPTYTPTTYTANIPGSSASIPGSSTSLPPPPNVSDLEPDDTSPVPPYMPIQGQRRTMTQDKSNCKEEKKFFLFKKKSKTKIK